MDIRIAEGGDAAALGDAFTAPGYIADRLDRQARGLGELFVAVEDGRPIGHGYLWRELPTPDRVATELGWTPTVARLEVRPERRGQGVGTRLLEAIERHAAGLGYHRIGLGVGVDNPAARRLYERLGYHDWGHGIVDAAWVSPDDPGVPRRQRCRWLVKTLDNGAPDVDAWAAWEPAEVAARLGDCPVPWAVAGGWAIDLHLGRQTREHSDVEIAIPRGDLPRLRSYLAGFDLYSVGDGRLIPLWTDDPPYHQVWVCDRAAQAWRMDTFLEPGDDRTWVSHRDARITLPMGEAVRRTADGIPFLAPATVLFAKAKHARAKDDGDLALTLPTLDPAERHWLATAVALVHPGHRWLELLAA